MSFFSNKNNIIFSATNSCLPALIDDDEICLKIIELCQRMDAVIDRLFIMIVCFQRLVKNNMERWINKSSFGLENSSKLCRIQNSLTFS